MEVNTPTKTSKILFWTPRVLTFLFTLFISLFALDIFDMKLGFWGTIVGLLMHLIPSFVLIIFFIIAWRYEWVGALGFFLFATWYVITMMISSLNSFEAYMISYSLIFSGSAVLIGILWLLNWERKRE